MDDIPIIFCPRPSFITRNQTSLIEELDKLGQKREDWHEECPVLDIIDPDLAANYYYSLAKIEASERSKYQWFPTDIIITPEEHLKLLGPIHNLPPKGNEILYKHILELFRHMIPGFKKLGFIEDQKQNSKLQIVFKAQKYVIQPGTSYSGKWHIEGKTENVVAGGVYYCRIDSGFDNDQVVFRPRQSPDPYFSSDMGIIVEQEADIQENSAIVFSNILPHKFLKLTNSTSFPLERLFVNFFVIDPRKPIESTTFAYMAEKALLSLKKFPRVIIEEILAFICYRPREQEAKEERKKARTAMKNEKTGWGFINYGNSGDIEFIDEQMSEERMECFEEFLDADNEKITAI